MRIREILRTSVVETDAKIEFRHADNTDDAMYMPPEVVAQFMSGLFDVGMRLLRAGAQQRAPVYELAGAKSVTTETNQQALVLTLRPGFDLTLAITPQLLGVLQACMRQIERDLKGGQIH